MRALAIVGAVIVTVVLLIVVGLAAGWIGGTAETVSFDHSKEQTTVVLDDWQSMKAAAANACEAGDSQQQSGDPTLVERPGFAYRAKYRQIKVDYDRRMGNFFEAANTRRLPIPDALHGLPREAPSLRHALREAGC